ncbi:MAG TPA: MoxR family ATPase [Candidatus Ventrousia excrementavium]|uniref:MoxR family ATPase n=1 Tax=Candidatus Ventrousia excrementavium TaxID=2840961 RepID=A0A9D1IVF3_9CLOT|nr:MoxR family ATPase [Candidatus Ventrousia excrementavium]
MNETLQAIVNEVEKAIVGKREVIEKVLMALLSGGHVLLDDVPGVGKTTLAVAVSRTLGLRYRRVQFTPDVLPSDIVGFSMYDRQAERLRYVPGVVSDANLLLGDEINRTSSKTQSALLEAMEEGQVTVDGEVHPLNAPFCVIATQNQVGTAGTQPLPQAQMDRFLVQLTIGYPDFKSQVEILRERQTQNPLDEVRQVSDRQAVLDMQRDVLAVTTSDALLEYITRLAEASREHPLLQLGISPRGALSVCRMARAHAYLYGRDFVIVEDVQAVFSDVCAHRVLLSQRARMEKASARQVMDGLLADVPLPHAVR